MSNFHDPDLTVKINAETYIKFDGSDHVLIKNIKAESGMSIKYDIFLILYELIDWKPMKELLAPWPKDDQQKILDHLTTLEKQHIVVTSETVDVNTVSESGLSAYLGKNIHINIENHHAMLRDFVRLGAYRRAIEQAVTADTTVLDLGCGVGILSFFAASAGAKHVTAIERRSDIILLAKAMAEVNQLDGKICFIEGTSSQLDSTTVDTKADIFISEILGNGILEENVLEYTIDARRRFLKPDAKMIPYRLDIYLFAYDSGLNINRSAEVEELNDLYGYDFGLMNDLLAQKATTRTDVYNTRLNTAMTEPVIVQSIDFRTLEETMFTSTISPTILEDGKITNFCAYFKAYLDESNTLTNSPWAPATHWTHLIYTLPTPTIVKKGENINIEVIYDGVLRAKLLNSSH